MQYVDLLKIGLIYFELDEMDDFNNSTPSWNLPRTKRNVTIIPFLSLAARVRLATSLHSGEPV